MSTSLALALSPWASNRPRPFSRDEIVRILDGMEINLLADTKLDDEKLHSRLRKGLDAAQRYYRFFPHSDVDPLIYPFWPKRRRLSPSFQRDHRSRDHQRALSSPGGAPSTELGRPEHEATPVTHERLFTKLSEKIDGMSDDWGSQSKHLSFMLKDDVSKRIIFIRILSVHEIRPHTPLIFLGYMVVNGLRKVEYDQLVSEYLHLGEGVDMYLLTSLEQDLLLHLLSLNRKHLSSNVKIPPGPHSHKLEISFLMPMTKLSQADITRLSKNSGCLVCGKNTTGVCEECHLAQYCGTSCQRRHWKVHKEFCRRSASQNNSLSNRL